VVRPPPRTHVAGNKGREMRVCERVSVSLTILVWRVRTCMEHDIYLLSHRCDSLLECQVPRSTLSCTEVQFSQCGCLFLLRYLPRPRPRHIGKTRGGGVHVT
jgi:hypothetical protein